MDESTVTVKGQTTLPKRVRDALGVGPGDRVRYLILDHGEVRLLRPRKVSDLGGSLHRPGQAPVSLDDMDDAIAAAASEG